MLELGIYIAFSITILVMAITNAFAIIGIYESTREGMIASRARTWLIGKVGFFWSKPFLNCTVCMSSIHSTYFYWGTYYFFMPHELMFQLFYILYIPILAGITTMIVNKTY